ncbi:hypothetical protein Q2T40_02835 [Winogradskyella maritima]|nr:hypothetical protein [Winogradskyella maritima]
MSMRQVPLEKQTEYAVEDADVTFQLAQHFRRNWQKRKPRTYLTILKFPFCGYWQIWNWKNKSGQGLFKFSFR